MGASLNFNVLLLLLIGSRIIVLGILLIVNEKPASGSHEDILGCRRGFCLVEKIRVVGWLTGQAHFGSLYLCYKLNAICLKDNVVHTHYGTNLYNLEKQPSYYYFKLCHTINAYRV